MSLTEVHPDIQASRQEVYGDPLENHRGIAQAWAGLLQPHAERIAQGKPIPPWVVALLLASLKINRMRRVFKQDNFDDAEVYLSFAKEWQSKGLE